MIAVLSPAKSLNEEHTIQGLDAPFFSKEVKSLIQILNKKSASDLMELMSISQNLADLNVRRFTQFSSRYTSNNSKAAIHTFNGDVYRGFDAQSLSSKQTAFCQKHVRILSGLYGVLKPMDKMQPYRLEMGSSLKNDIGPNLYHFWGDKISHRLDQDLRGHQDKTIINLASKEYFSAIKIKALKASVINVDFKEYRNGALKSISFNAKRARGLMARYMVDNELDHPDKLKGFNAENYAFDDELSTKDKWLFTRQTI